MKKLCLGFLALTMASTVFAASGSRAGFVTYADIVNIEEVWHTAKIKRYTDCRDVGSTTLCDTIEWITVNDTIDFYRVTYDLYGKLFKLKHKKRPVSLRKKMSISVTTYGK
jgi:hypothetical protein